MYDTKAIAGNTKREKKKSHLKDLDQITITFRSDTWIIWVSSDGHLFDAIFEDSTSWHHLEEKKN